MDEFEAQGWLAGTRTTANMIPSTENYYVQVAQADAAMMQQAYWVLKAYKEGLLSD